MNDEKKSSVTVRPLDGGTIHESLSQLLTGMAAAFNAERQTTEPFREMFKAGSTFTGLLRRLESECMGHVLDACTVFEQKTGKKVSHELIEFLLATPYLSYKLEKHIDQTEGGCCHVDKSFFLLSEELKRIVGS